MKDVLGKKINFIYLDDGYNIHPTGQPTTINSERGGNTPRGKIPLSKDAWLPHCKFGLVYVFRSGAEDAIFEDAWKEIFGRIM